MKINVKQVLSEAISFYKENFKHLAGVSFIIFMYTAFMQLRTFIQTMLKHPIHAGLFQIVALIVMIAATVNIPKLYLSIMIMINSIYTKNKMALREAYGQTKGKYWLMIGCSLLIALWLIPYALFAFLEIPFTFVIGGIYTTFIASFYYTLFPMIAIETKTNQYLKKSAQMVKGNYASVFVLAFISIKFLLIIIGILTYIFQSQTAELIIKGIIYPILCFFVTPFENIIIVIVYRRLAAK